MAQNAMHMQKALQVVLFAPCHGYYSFIFNLFYCISGSYLSGKKYCQDLKHPMLCMHATVSFRILEQAALHSCSLAVFCIKS